MGEFPDPAIHGDPVSTGPSVLVPMPTSSMDPVVSSFTAPTSQSSTISEVETSTSDEPTTSETTVVPETSTRFTTSKVVETMTSVPASTSTSSSAVVMTSTVQSTPALLVPTSTIPTTTTFTPTPSAPHTTFTVKGTSRSTISLTTTSTRPIITPIPSSTYTPSTPTELVSSSSHLSLGEIVGIVAVVSIVLGVFSFCVVLGPRRAMRSVGFRTERKERGDEEDDVWEEKEEGGTVRRMSSDWWSLRAPAGAFGTRMSGLSVGGPGMAGVGAGGRTVQDPEPQVQVQAQAQDIQTPGSTSRRPTVRSGWFAASMVRGASLLSLGSMLKPEPASPNHGDIGQGGQGSAGRRFQELYRRERAAEMGERPVRSSRVPYPAVKRPSRLGGVPTILVQDATLPSLSSASHVTGYGYDADVERV